MGQFGPGLFHGDPAMDWADRITRKLQLEGIDNDPENWSPRLAKFVGKCMNKYTVKRLCDFVRKNAEDADECGLGLMVVGSWAAAGNAFIDTEEYRDIGAAFELEEWSNKDPERRDALDPIWRSIVRMTHTQKPPEKKHDRQTNLGRR